MKVYYQKPKNFLDRDISAALAGFKNLNYEICEVADLDQVEKINKSNVFLGDVNQTKYVLGKANKSIDCDDYPECLSGLYGRRIESDTLQNAFPLDGSFIKPKVKGLFTPSHELSPWQTMHLREDTEVWRQDYVQMRAEFRAFVFNNRIQDVRQYKGKYYLTPDYQFMNVAKNLLRKSPAIIDFYLSPRKDTCVLEVNPSICFGSYGLNPLTYAKIIEKTWRNIIDG